MRSPEEKSRIGLALLYFVACDDETKVLFQIKVKPSALLIFAFIYFERFRGNGLLFQMHELNLSSV
jgi:hypothetical protein